MVALTELLGAVVGWFARSRRRQIALLVLPLLVAVALTARGGGDSPEPRPTGVLAGGGADRSAANGADESGGQPGAGEPSATTVPATGLPATTGPAPGPSAPTRAAPPLPAGAVKVATSYAVTVNTHDARPGKDHGFLDSYLRARPYLTPQLFTVVTTPSRRGDVEWGQWQQAQATVTAQVQQVTLPDGAPLPTATAVYLQVQFRQVVTAHAAGASGGVQPGALTLVAARTGSGKWLVSQLLVST